jgi:hypothetical protein
MNLKNSIKIDFFMATKSLNDESHINLNNKVWEKVNIKLYEQLYEQLYFQLYEEICDYLS